MKEKFTEEIKILESVYSELIEALLNKPESQDYETSRIYFENVTARMNNWAAMVNKVKAVVLLSITADIGSITEFWRPMHDQS